jgi:hypothetical protein
MSDDLPRSAWSGCCRCPITGNLGDTWSDITPWPGFEKPSYGYYSFPLRASYLPFPLSPYFARTSEHIFAQVRQANAGTAIAIIAHEQQGHRSDKALSKFLVNLAVAEAYTALADLLNGIGEPQVAYQRIDYWNRIISIITETCALIDELYATLLGIEALRHSPTYKELAEESITDMQFNFVKRQSDLFGENFRELYEQMSGLYGRAGALPVQLLKAYADIRFDIFHDHGVLEVKADIDDKLSVEERLRKGLEIFLTVANSGQNVNRWTWQEWFEKLDRYLPNWTEGIRRGLFVAESLDDIFCQKLRHFNYDLYRRGGLDPDPGLIMSKDFLQGLMDNPLAFLSEHELGTIGQDALLHPVLNPLTGVLIGMRSRAKIDMHDPYAAPERLRSLTETEVEKTFVEQVLASRQNNQTSLSFTCEPNNYGLFFLPRFEEGCSEPTIAAEFVTSWHTRSTDPAERERRWMAEQGLRDVLAFQQFYEGARHMVGSRTGIRCPMLKAAGPHGWYPRLDGVLRDCCGLAPLLASLYKAGRQVQEKLGIPFGRWELPPCCRAMG